MKLTDTAADAGVEDGRRSGVVKPKRLGSDGAAIDAEGTAFAGRTNAEGVVDFGVADADVEGAGEGAERAAGADVGTLDPVADDAGRDVGVDGRRSGGGGVVGEWDDAVRGADVDAVSAAQAGAQEIRFGDGAGGAEKGARRVGRETFLKEVGEGPQDAGEGLMEEGPAGGRGGEVGHLIFPRPATEDILARWTEDR